MNWEALKVYRPLSKEELKPAFKKFTKIIADNFSTFGFQLNGRKLIRLSNDLLQVIHLDTRGNWTGISESFETEISLIAVCDKSPFIRNLELTATKRIQDIAIGIKDYYRITQEYELLADFLTRKLKENILPYFGKYESSLDVLKHSTDFKLGELNENNNNLILFCELQNKTNIHSANIIDKILSRYEEYYPDKTEPTEYINELQIYKKGLKNGDWEVIDYNLSDNRNLVLKKLKLT